MTPHEIAYEQIHHRETEQIPYTLTFKPELKSRLDEHFGGSDWREKLT